jgi:hypothetical protein
MGQERIIVRHKHWQEKREVQYWTRLLNITESEARRLAETMNKPVNTPPTPESVRPNKKSAALVRGLVAITNSPPLSRQPT